MRSTHWSRSGFVEQNLTRRASCSWHKRPLRRGHVVTQERSRVFYVGTTYSTFLRPKTVVTPFTPYEGRHVVTFAITMATKSRHTRTVINYPSVTSHYFKLYIMYSIP